MFLKCFNFYLTGLFTLFCKIWYIFYSYHNDVIVMKNDVKVIYICSARQTQNWLEKAQQSLERKKYHLYRQSTEILS